MSSRRRVSSSSLRRQGSSILVWAYFRGSEARARAVSSSSSYSPLLRVSVVIGAARVASGPLPGYHKRHSGDVVFSLYIILYAYYGIFGTLTLALFCVSFRLSPRPKFALNMNPPGLSISTTVSPPSKIELFTVLILWPVQLN